jgi:predicted signal transduction protein with EAL and GGDEF domain
VTRNLQDVRHVLWEFTNIVGRAIVEDQETDQKVSNHLAQLRTATEGGSFQEVKQTLFAVVQGINMLIDERTKRLVSTFPRKTDFIARYGGEEFCVLLQGAGQELGQRLGERVLDAVRREEFHYQDIRIPATVSVCVAELMPGETLPWWLERADRALYRAKDCGRDQLCRAIETPGAVQAF